MKSLGIIAAQEMTSPRKDWMTEMETRLNELDVKIEGTTNIDDTTTQPGGTWSSEKIDGELDYKANLLHYHRWTDITQKPEAFPPSTATATAVGGVKVGSGLTVGLDGTLSTDLTQIASKTEVNSKISTVNGLSPDGTGNVSVAIPSITSLATKEELAAVASGTPKGTYATLAALQTAFPTGTTGVYVVQATGFVYAWLSGAWTSLFQYQGVTVSDGSITRDKLEADLRNKITNFTQLANNIYMHQGLDTSKTVIVNSNTAEITTNTTYGQIGFTVPNVQGNKYRVSMTVTNIGLTAAMNVRMRTAYSNNAAANSTVVVNGAQIGAYYNIGVGSSQTWEEEIITDQPNAAVIFGVSANVSGTVLRMTQKVYNVTDLSDDVRNNIDWNNIPRYVLQAELSSKAITAGVSEWANDGDFVKPIELLDRVQSSNIQSIRANGSVLEYSIDGSEWLSVQPIMMNHKPTYGTYPRAKQIINLEPTPGGHLGWVCVTAGIANEIPWQSNVSYEAGNLVYSGENVYRCLTGGTSGTDTLVGTSASFSDGVCVWEYVNTKAVFKEFGPISV